MSVTHDYAAFDVRAYLQEYYADMGRENLALLRFLVQAFRDVPEESLMLDFGAGPTLYSAIVAAARVREIHFSDYSEANLDQVQSWLHACECMHSPGVHPRDPAAFDWHVFTQKVLELEGNDASLPSIIAREEAVRKRVTRVMHCDAHAPCPIGQGACQYDVLTTNFCAEAAANDRAQWRQCMRNITSLLKPGGRLILSAVKGADSYAVGEAAFFAVNLAEGDLVEMLLETGFAQESIVVESTPADRPDRHYQGLLFAVATKLPQATSPKDEAERVPAECVPMAIAAGAAYASQSECVPPA